MALMLRLRQVFNFGRKFLHTTPTANYYKSTSKSVCLAIRRETVSVWERRAPLAPSQVRILVQSGVKVLVQPSNRRAYTAQEYTKVGAVVKEDISDATVVIGVKQVPTDYTNLMPNKTYAFFSHTIKAQEDNMELLESCLERNIRLLDYECMVSDKGRRVVAFGQYAGAAGMINILHGMGLRFLALGHHTPFMHIGPAHNYRSIGMATQSIRDTGYEISLGNMPASIGPLTFVFTGTGNVSQGARDVFQELPHEFVDVQHLPDVSKYGATNRVYGCVVSRHDHLQRREGGGFDPDEFDIHPERYASSFSRKIAPYTSCLLNGIYWDPNAPRLITIPDAKRLLHDHLHDPWLETSPGCPPLPHKLLALCDISADPGGSIEFMKECTTIDKPYCLYDAEENVSYEKFDGPGVLICSIDNMPTQLPRESTEYFGQLLLPYVSDLLKSNAETSLDEYKGSDVVKNAFITSNGSLTPRFEYITNLRDSLRKAKNIRLSAQQARKSVLVLGAGHVAGPMAEYLSRDPTLSMTVVSDVKREAEALASSVGNTTPEHLDIVQDADVVEKLVAQHDVTVSLLPWSFHEQVLKMCLRKKKHLVTASYCTPEISELAEEAEKEGLSVVMEVGLDPGIDHMLAMECFDDAAAKGARVTSYISYTGGLPAPENSDNPLRYKFSWSPESALLTAVNPSKYLENNKVVEIRPGGELMRNAKPMEVLPGFNLECYPNRDSTKYAELYGIDDAVTVLRGTLRYKGFSDALWGLIQLGLLDTTPHPLLHPEGPDITWKAFVESCMSQPRDVFTGTLKNAVFDRLGQDTVKFNAIEGLGLFDDDTSIDKRSSPLGTLSRYLSKRLAYEPGERDVVIMTHQVLIQHQDNSTERMDIRLVVYGEPYGYSAMAKTVGYPTGIAIKMLLEEEVQSRGLVLPLSRTIYRPVLKRLKQENIEATEKTVFT